MNEQNYSGAQEGQNSINAMPLNGSINESPLNQAHLLTDDLDESAEEDDELECSDKISARRKIEDLLEERRLKRLTQDFDFDDM